MTDGPTVTTHVSTGRGRGPPRLRLRLRLGSQSPRHRMYCTCHVHARTDSTDPPMYLPADDSVRGLEPGSLEPGTWNLEPGAWRRDVSCLLSCCFAVLLCASATCTFGTSDCYAAGVRQIRNAKKGAPSAERASLMACAGAVFRGSARWRYREASSAVGWVVGYVSEALKLGAEADMAWNSMAI